MPNLVLNIDSYVPADGLALAHPWHKVGPAHVSDQLWAAIKP